MSKSKTEATSRRRDFIKLATLGTLAGAATISARPIKAEASVAKDARSTGYRETEHVKKVYELSRF